MLVSCEHLDVAAEIDPAFEPTEILVAQEPDELVEVDPPLAPEPEPEPVPEVPLVTRPEPAEPTPESESLPVEIATPMVPPSEPLIKKNKKFDRPGKFERVRSLCSVFQEADQKSQIFNQVDTGRKLWIERVNDDWRLVYTKIGPAFMKAECFSDHKAETESPIVPAVTETVEPPPPPPPPSPTNEEPIVVEPPPPPPPQPRSNIAKMVEPVLAEKASGSEILVALAIAGGVAFAVGAVMISRRRQLHQELQTAFTQF